MRVDECNAGGRYRCNEGHCPRCEQVWALERSVALKHNYEEQKTEHPRLGFFAFTAGLVDVGFGSIRSAVRELGKGMRQILGSVRAYPGSYWQVEVLPSGLNAGLVNVHSHAAVMIPAKGKPGADDVCALAQHHLGNLRTSNWEPVRDIDDWGAYVTKAEQLAGLDDEFFELYFDQLYRQPMRGTAN